jgi:uncharacterized protein (TIGR00369 family)
MRRLPDPFLDDPVVQGPGGLALIAQLGLWSGGPGRVGLSITPRRLNGAGLLLGPVGFALVDLAMTSAVWSALGTGEAAATLSVALNYVQSAGTGEVSCHAILDRRGRTAATVRATVVHEDGRLLVTAVGSFSIYARD